MTLVRAVLAVAVVAALPVPACAADASFAAGSPPVQVGADGDRARAIECMATAIAYEAPFEPIEGREAIAEVILNRARTPGYPRSVCGVVFAGAERRTGCQFTFACDGSLVRRPATEAVMAASRIIATAAIDGTTPLRAPGATHYHASYVAPWWAPSLVRIIRIGTHIFYRGPGARDQLPNPLRFLPGQEPALMTAAEPRRTATAGSLSPSVPATFSPWGLPLSSTTAGH